MYLAGPASDLAGPADLPLLIQMAGGITARGFTGRMQIERFSGNKHTTEYPAQSIDAMVATLVVTLPSAHTGGEPEVLDASAILEYFAPAVQLGLWPRTGGRAEGYSPGQSPLLPYPRSFLYPRLFGMV